MPEGVEDPHLRGGELDRERQPVEPATDVSQVRALPCGDREVRV